MSSEANQWLPMPSGISLDRHSFTLDILEQFNCEETTENKTDEQKELSNNNNNNNDNNNNSSNSNSSEHISKASSNIPHKLEDKRRRSAGDLIRKSSAYLKNKKWNESLTWSQKKKKNYPPPVQDIFPNQPPTKKLSKVAINTTISISPSNSNHTRDLMEGVQPIVIAHYPPKPLKYSPVEPLPEASPELKEKKSKTLHRLSIPLLKMTAVLHHENDKDLRRRSDSDLVYNKDDGNGSYLSKKWNKFISGWKKTLKKKKDEPIHS